MLPFEAPGWYPPLSTLPVLVADRGQSQASIVRKRCAGGRNEANDVVFGSAEALYASRVGGCRYAVGYVLCIGSIDRVKSGSREDESALVAGGELAVDQASVCRSRHARNDQSAQIGNGGRKTGYRIGGCVRHLSCSKSALRRSRRRLVRSNTCAQQVWNGNSCNDQDDGHHDQQLDY